MITEYHRTVGGFRYLAVHLSWAQVEQILDRKHDGDAEDDEKVIAWVAANGGPDWVAEPGIEGWIDEAGWGLIGPRVEDE